MIDVNWKNRVFRREMKMAERPRTRVPNEKVFYTLRPKKAGRSAFSDVRLPDGTVIRRVDESVHKRALSNVRRAYKEKA